MKSALKTRPVQRLEHLDAADFAKDYLAAGVPVVLRIPDCNAKQWTLDSLRQTAGDCAATVRVNTDKPAYKVGKAYDIRTMKLREYIDLVDTKSAGNMYMAVQNISHCFPVLQPDLPELPHLGKLHQGPFLWIAQQGHYEYCHIDPDDGMLLILNGRKTVRIFDDVNFRRLYPNPLGAKGRTLQAQVDCDNPDLEQFPDYADAEAYECTVSSGEMLFIPAFFWHQVTSVETTVSINYFFGDSSSSQYLAKIMQEPRYSVFSFWFLNIIEQNRLSLSFHRVLQRLDESIERFILKQWHEIPTAEQKTKLRELVLRHCGLQDVPPMTDVEIATMAKHPPPIKIRGLRWRKNDNDDSD
eukprot:m.66767 g.66767  ORF g.66767 m.66767 type:complete len:355 (-) comp14067_c0_seq1:118-1182(-)